MLAPPDRLTVWLNVQESRGMGRDPKKWRWCRLRPCRRKPGWTLDYVNTDDKRRQVYAGRTVEEAVAFKHQLETDGKIKGSAPKVPTLRQYVLAWLEARVNDVAPSTLARDRRRLMARILPRLGHLALDAITHAALIEYKTWAIAHSSPANWNRDRALLSAIFTSAYRDEFIARHPIKGLVSAATERPAERRVLTELEHVRFFEAAEQIDAESRGWPWVYDYYLICFDTAARPGREISTLEWTDLDFDEGIIRIRHPKAGRRRNRVDVVYMTDRLKTCLQARHEGRRSDKYVFPGRDAHRPLVNHYKGFRAAVRRAGLPGDVVPYCGRHTALTTLGRALAGPDVQDVARHSTLAMTQRYMRASREAGKAAAQILGRVGEPSEKLRRKKEAG